MDSVVQQVLVLISTQNEPRRSSLTALLQQPEMEPEEVMVVFHQFFILDTLTYHSDTILALIHDKYFEEFKLAAAFDFCMSNSFV